MTIFCAGLESSGNYWVRSVLAQHPDLEVAGDSFPSSVGEGRHYPESAGHDALIVIYRDQTCQEESVLRLGYNDGNDRKFTRAENMEAIAELIQQSDLVVFVSYESAIAWQQIYWDNIFRQLGVSPVKVETEYLDGNAKYLTPV